MASLKDIANKSGFSIRTVSRVLQNTGYVKEDTRGRILETAHTLGYRPNRFARSLRTGRSCLVTVILTSIDELYIEKVAGLDEVLRAHGFTVDLLLSHPGTDVSQDDYVLCTREDIQERSSAGVVCFPRGDLRQTELVADLENSGIPCMALDAGDLPLDRVSIDRQQGVYEAVKYLSNSGRKRIAYLGKEDDPTRLDGYNRAMRDLGREPVYLYMPLNSSLPQMSFNLGRDMGVKFSALAGRPDAVQAYSDEVALGFLAGLHENGVKVPDDVALVGFDNRRASQLCWPSLTTVAQPNRAAGAAAAEMLLKKIAGEPRPAGGWVKDLPTELIVREST